MRGQSRGARRTWPAILRSDVQGAAARRRPAPKSRWSAATSPARARSPSRSRCSARCAARHCGATPRGPATPSTSPARWATRPPDCASSRDGFARAPPRASFLSIASCNRPRACRPGLRLARIKPAPAAIDLSDGLWQDLGHILERSGAGAEIDAGALPLSAAYRATVGDDPALALGGGEDYELLFCLRRAVAAPALTRSLGVRVSRIGRITSSGKAVLVMRAVRSAMRTRRRRSRDGTSCARSRAGRRSSYRRCCYYWSSCCSERAPCSPRRKPRCSRWRGCSTRARAWAKRRQRPSIRCCAVRSNR